MGTQIHNPSGFSLAVVLGHFCLNLLLGMTLETSGDQQKYCKLVYILFTDLVSFLGFIV